MIGYFGYSMWLTYASLISAVVGIFVSLAGNGHPYIGSMFLLFSGLCDAFDGKVARLDKNRTEREKRYGIQLDSLSDLVAFGVLPCCIGSALYRAALTAYRLLAPEDKPELLLFIPYWIYVAIFCLYVVAALVRLAWFNVTEEENLAAGQTVRKVYTGLPVTSAALIFPTFLLLSRLEPADIAVGYYGVMLLTAALFVCKFNVRKPGLKGILIMVGIGVVEFAIILLLKFLGVRAF